MKVFLKTILCGLLPVFAFSVFAQPARYIEGTHFEAVPTVSRTADPDKVEVMEIFWYGCNHCYAFEPLIENWKAKQPEDVNFVLSPGMWNDIMMTHARLYYTAVELGIREDVHAEIYDEIQLRGNYLDTEAKIKAFLSGNGADAAAFDRAWSSFTVSSNVNRANARMRDYGVRGTPTMIVNGKWRVSSNQAVPTHSDMLEVVDYLVELERSE